MAFVFDFIIKMQDLGVSGACRFINFAHEPRPKHSATVLFSGASGLRVSLRNQESQNIELNLLMLLNHVLQ